MKLFSYIIYSLLILTLLGKPQTLQNYNKELTLDKKLDYNVKERDPDLQMHFELKIPENFDPKKRLAVMTRPNDYRSDPDLFIHNSINEPTIEQIYKTESKHFCYHYGPDFCLIPQDYVKPGETVFVTVYIQYGPCNFNMVVKTVEPPTDVEFNKEYEIILQDDDKDYAETLAEYITVKLPTKKEAPNVNQMIVAVVRMNHASGYYMSSMMNEDDIRLMYTMGKDNDPRTTNQFIDEGLYNLENGMIFQIDEDSPLWKRGETYNFMVTSQDKDHLRLVTFLRNKSDIQELKFDKYFAIQEFNSIPNLLMRGDAQTYVIKNYERIHQEKYIQDQKMSTLIQMHESYGDVDLYVSCKQSLDFRADALFQTLEKGSEMLLISSEELDENCKELYITAFATRDTIYKLDITFRSEDLHNNTVMPIKPYVAEQGYLKADELASYILELKRDQPYNVTVSLHALQGNTDLFIKACGRNDECFDMFDEFKKFNKDDKTSGYMAFSNIEGNDAISFEHNEQTCVQYEKESQNRPYCFYMIMVYNKQYKENKGAVNQNLKYELEVSLNHKQKYLRENDLIYDTVMVGNYNYYKFEINSFDNIENIVFIITPLSGDPNILVSRTEQKPVYRNTDKATLAWFNYVEYLRQELVEKPTNTTFFIGVHGFTESRYTLRVQIDRADGTQQTEAINLVNGVTMNSFFNIDQTHLFFDFPIRNNVKKNNMLQFQIFEYDRKNKDHVTKMYARKLYSSDQSVFEKDVKKYEYQNTQKWPVMQIDRDSDTEEDKEGFIGYRIMVTRPEDGKFQKLFFEILPQSLESFVEVVPGQEREFIIYKEQEIDKQQEQVRALMIKFIVNLEEDEEVHLGMNSEIFRNIFQAQFFSIMKNALENFNHDQNHVSATKKQDKYFMAYINFNQKELQRLCKDQPKKHCKIYGLLKVFNQQDSIAQDYNIKANVLLLKINKKMNASPIQLTMNKNIKIPVLSNFLDKGVTYTMYYKVDNIKKAFFIDIQSSGDQQVHVEFRNQLEANYEPKNIDKFDKGSSSSHYHREFTPKEMTGDGCVYNQPCILLVNVRSNYNFKLLNVQIGQDIMDISDKMNDFIKGRVRQNQYRYYKIYQNEDFEHNKISLTMLNGGDANIVAYYNEKDESFRPIEEKKPCEKAPKNSICLLSNKNKNDEITFKPAKKGYYIIGVYGTDIGDNLYTLHWSSNALIKELQQGVAQKIQAKPQKFSHYFYTTSSSSIHNVMGLLTSKMPLQENLVIKIGVCDDTKSDLLSQKKKFCDPEKGLKYYQQFEVTEMNFAVDVKTLCEGISGPECHLVFSFQSQISKKELNFELLLVEEIENEQHLILKPNQYYQNVIQENKTHRFQILFQNPDEQKDCFLNVNSISGHVDIKVKPDNLRVHPVTGQDNKIWTKITKNHFSQFGGSQYQINYIEVEVSGCDEEYGCEYGIGLSVEGSSFILTPGLQYTGVLQEGGSQYFETFVDRALNDQKRVYLTITTFVHWRLNVTDLYLAVHMDQSKGFNNTDIQYFDIKRGYTSMVVPIDAKNPSVELKIVDKNIGKKFQNEVDFTLLLHSGRAEEINALGSTKGQQIVRQKFSSDESDIFFITSKQDGTMYLKVQECQGTYKIKQGDSFDELLGKVKNQETANDKDEAFLKIKAGEKRFVSIQQDKKQLNVNSTDKIPVYVGLYNLQAYFFKEQQFKQADLPQQLIKAGKNGEIQTFYEKDTIKVSFSDVKLLRDNITKNHQNYKPLRARIQVTSGNKQDNTNLQVCSNLPKQKAVKRRQLQKSWMPNMNDIMSKIEKEKAYIRDKSVFSEVYIIDDLQKYIITKENKDKYGNFDYQYTLDRTNLQRAFPGFKELYVSVTLIVPSEYYSNLPVQNLFDLEVFYAPRQIKMETIKKQTPNTEGFKEETKQFSHTNLIIYFIMGGLLIIVAYLAIRTYRKYKMQKNMKKDGGVRMSDHIDLDENVGNRSNPGTESFDGDEQL